MERDGTMSGCFDGIIMILIVLFLFVLASAYVSNPMFWLFMILIAIIAVVLGGSSRKG
jgi:hypothetical protein